MNRATQSVAIAFLGAILVRITVTSEYLRFVQSWMRWPVLITGVLLLALAAYPLLGLRGRRGLHGGRPEHADHAAHADHRDDDGHGHGALTRTTWLLFLPGLIMFLVSPPALGAFLAEHRAADSVAPPNIAFAPLPDGDPVDVDVYEYLWRAATGGGDTVRDRQVRLTGFVSTDGNDWFVTRVSIRCCAADATVARVKVSGLPAPARDSWVAVTGTLASATDRDAESVVLAGSAATPVPTPKDPYQ